MLLLEKNWGAVPSALNAEQKNQLCEVCVRRSLASLPKVWKNLLFRENFYATKMWLLRLMVCFGGRLLIKYKQ